MSNIHEVLDRAVNDGVITPDQKEQLFPYFGRSTGATDGQQTIKSELSELLAYEPVNPVEDSEMPRFIRGFHDILITIGVLIGVFGLWGIGTAYAVIPVILILSELLVRRQRLALPAVVLTVLLFSATLVILEQHLTVFDANGYAAGDYFENESLTSFFYVLPIPFVLGLYYSRYKVPLALAGAIFAGGTTILLSIQLIMSVASHQPHFVEKHPQIFIVMVFLTAVAIFLRALRMDFRDPLRLTRRSDVAFWLHLMAAPTLLYSTLSLVFMDDVSKVLDSGNMNTSQAIIVLVIVAIFMKIGLLLDRRAFVTAGLLSLGLAIWSIFEKNSFSGTISFYVIPIIIGILVLSLGMGWPHIRRLMFRFLPEIVTKKLPPLR